VTIRPVLIGAAGILTLQLLVVPAEPRAGSAPPYGWSVSDTIGRQYRLGYDAREQAYFIENTGPIKAAGEDVNETSQGAEQPVKDGAHRVPYAKGFTPSDLWAASLLQSVKATPYQNSKLQFQAEIKTVGFTGHALIELRATSPDKTWSTNTITLLSGEAGSLDWQTMTSSIDAIPEFAASESGQGSVTFGLVVRGEGRILIRNAKLVQEQIKAPLPQEPPKLGEIFGSPEAGDQPINVDLRR
jgi:hypothetical protein